MKRALVLLLVLLFSTCAYAEIIAQDAATVQEAVPGGDISAAIKKVVLDNLGTIGKENMSAMMATIHTQSPGYLITKQQTQEIFDTFDISYELKYYQYIGQDGGYAVARVIQVTKKISGPAFQNNELDMIQVFKQEDGVWKYWSQAILDAKYL
ncbi:MAG: hypothetical protein ABH843_05840 [Candidatus Omnitrophota bacterium]